MVNLLTLLIALTSASPSPMPSASPVPALHEIMRVRSSALCAEFASHANGAIDAATSNDTTLVRLVDSLGRAKMDDSRLAWNNELLRLERMSDKITQQWRTGEREVAQVRALAAKSTDPQEKSELTSSANALGGALWRQRRIARDLDGFIAFMETDQMMTNTVAEGKANQMVFGTTDPVHDPSFGDSVNMHNAMVARSYEAPPDTVPFPGDPNNPKPSEQAMAAAKDFARRLGAIGQDEIQAAVHIEQASEGC
ncbi:MAG: hypothetical protein ACYDGM_00100 [Vulcanimicrobiaceae bacterium]